MARKVDNAFLIMELLVALAILSIAFGSFLKVYQSILRQQAGLKHRTAAIMLLQSTLEKVRGGQLPEALTAANWSPIAGGHVACPAEPALYQLENASSGYHWQLVAEHPPEHGQLFTLEAVISWQDRAVDHELKASTQVWLP